MIAAAKHTAFGSTMTLREWSQDPRCLVDLPALNRRISRNWPMETALTKPARGQLAIGPLSGNSDAKWAFHRIDLPTPTRITNSSQRELYRTPVWPAPSNGNRRVA